MSDEETSTQEPIRGPIEEPILDPEPEDLTASTRIGALPIAERSEALSREVDRLEAALDDLSSGGQPTSSPTGDEDSGGQAPA